MAGGHAKYIPGEVVNVGNDCACYGACVKWTGVECVDVENDCVCCGTCVK